MRKNEREKIIEDMWGMMESKAKIMIKLINENQEGNMFDGWCYNSVKVHLDEFEKCMNVIGKLKTN